MKSSAEFHQNGAVIDNMSTLYIRRNGRWCVMTPAECKAYFSGEKVQ